MAERQEEAEESLDELEELAKTAGAETAARVIQIRETPHPATYIGKGKIDEVNALLYGTDATGLFVTMNCPRRRLEIWSVCWIQKSWTAPF